MSDVDRHAAQYRWLLENCIQEDENGWAVLHFETARQLKTHPQIVEWMDGDIESAMMLAQWEI